ncbi:MAG TPA: electron transfer flavoprotein subunit beta/FixA family protein [Deltaproteobacteria bacterium]|jgi:electron transfer flavoprotein beta subunit|nr:electron transfer flavoprotein subunit beta/FixA family protein [Deltaproteobacteria bacterium]OQC29321.1 MAG: Acryloyl-CoA reductase electron transfer subunit gamma [Deltaproteobacteria bacterium ADurb.Bin072]HRW81274.1 electron transfer flavoprotein subunit beta/FixA family protein [Desulfomonilia bacterium]NMD41665.1 electron transfer flavoprotein subunit beta/FixA family protein [Deltaproteobacteria bacterium]HNQ85024.1 electron transfer flavoprotein subunit beta/FixA family protein [Del
MVKMIVCMKQVPMAAELPWDPKTRTLRRDLADGMMNPACKHALEAALTVKHDQGGHVTAITMGPPMAEEILREAIAMGVDRCLMLSDPAMAGADTVVTSYTLARAIEIFCPDFDLILTGCHTTDSETAQVGPQLAEELGIPGIAYVDEMAVTDGHIRVRRISDDFLETLETDLPCLLTVNIGHYAPRYVPLSGLQEAFGEVNILAVSAADLGIDPAFIGVRGSPTRILDVFAPRAEKENIVLTGAPKKIVEELFERFDAKIGGIIKKDIKWEGRG